MSDTEKKTTESLVVHEVRDAQSLGRTNVEKAQSLGSNPDTLLESQNLNPVASLAPVRRSPSSENVKEGRAIAQRVIRERTSSKDKGQ